KYREEVPTVVSEPKARFIEERKKNQIGIRSFFKKGLKKTNFDLGKIENRERETRFDIGKIEPEKRKKRRKKHTGCAKEKPPPLVARKEERPPPPSLEKNQEPELQLIATGRRELILALICIEEEA
nr:hypothetical protein [Tanacetum cinerariifolium]